MKLPEIKKEVKDFLSEDSGVITKENIIKTGILVGGVLALAKNVSAACARWDHSNDMGLAYDPASNTATGTHTHHAEHCSVT